MKLLSLKKSLFEVVSSIIPMVVIIIILGLTLTGFTTDDGENLVMPLIAGTIMIIIGMTMFLSGANVSMMEIGKRAGTFLVQKRKLSLVILLGFIIGFSVTIAEPDVQVLSTQVTAVSEGAISRVLLVSVVGAGVGIFMVLGIMRIALQKKLVFMLGIGYGIAFLIAFFFTHASFFSIAFDSGGVTTGPITVPFILAFSAGITSTIRSQKKGDDSFGMVGLASLGPIIAVLILGAIF